MEIKDKLAIMKKHGICKVLAKGRVAGLYTMVCQGCGKVIRSDGDLSDIEMSVTKRGSAYAWHTKCSKKAWESKIKWEKERR